jgi:hypothetical protein
LVTDAELFVRELSSALDGLAAGEGVAAVEAGS